MLNLNKTSIKICNLFGLLGLLLSVFACQQMLNEEKEQVRTEQVTNKTVKANYYQEAHRPQFHFSPQEMWMNDPNGMVFYEGEYHLFYQHYPDSTVWGPMHWGHAISTDLVHWEHLPIALYPDSLGYIFSGSAVVDWKNTSGFGKNGQPPLIAIFTYHEPKGAAAGTSDFQYQGIAYSNDKGRTWTKYEGNPVVPNTKKIKDFRDPKVIWDEDSDQWVMVFAAYDHAKLYGSKDLKKWTHLSDWGQAYGVHDGVWECPDLFPMTVEGTDEKKWVLIQSLNPGGPNGGSGTQYFIGDFDGKNFILDKQFAKEVPKGKALWLDYGRDNYAGVTWSDIPAKDGRRLFLGWMSNWDYAQIVPTEKWRSATTLARKMKLIKQPEGYRILSTPVKELEKIRTKKIALTATEIESTLPINSAAPLSEMVLTFQNPTADSRFGIELSNSKGELYRIGYDASTNTYFSDRTKSGDASFSNKFASKLHTAPRLSNKELIDLHLFFDLASAELFADGGTTVLTDIFFPSEDFTQYQLFCDKGSVSLKEGTFYELKSIWK